jgi:hypothetical protein
MTSSSRIGWDGLWRPKNSVHYLSVRRRTDWKSGHSRLTSQARKIDKPPHQHLLHRDVFLKLINYATLIIGKHATPAQKIAFLAYLHHVSCAEAAQLAGLSNTTGKDLKACAGTLQVAYAKAGLPLPTLKEQVQRKPSIGPKTRLTIDLINRLL